MEAEVSEMLKPPKSGEAKAEQAEAKAKQAEAKAKQAKAEADAKLKQKDIDVACKLKAMPCG